MNRLIIIISFLILFFTNNYLIANNNDSISYFNYDNSNVYTIADIRIIGLKYLQPGVLANVSGLNIGDKITIPGDDITKAINRYWKYGLFSDVKIIAEKFEGDKVFLAIYLTERPRLGKINIHGVRKGEVNDLMEKIQLKPGIQLTENTLNKTEHIIRKHYTGKGFYNVKIKMIPVTDTTAFNTANLDIHIEKGPKVKIKEIVFNGNNDFTDKRLRRVLKKTKEKSINFFRSAKLNEADFKEDKEKLITFYNEHGYRDARILNTSIEKINEKYLRIVIDLEEGKKYYIRNITWIGNTKYPSEILSKILGFKKGDVYNQKLLEERLRTNEDAVSSLYLDNGYLFFSVEAAETKIENDSIDLEIRIREGEQATINKIIIKGNTKTNEHVIRRELYTRPGQLFSKSDIIRSVRELANLGHFDPEKISPNPLPNFADGTVDIEYSLEERANDQLEVSGGWGGFGFVGTIGIRFSNFSTRNLFNLKAWRPVPTGDGQSLAIRAQSNGRYYQSYSISFTEPWFGGKKPNSFSFSLYHTAMKPTDYYSYQTKEGYFRLYGASIGLGVRLKWPDDYFSLYNEMSFQKYNLYKWTGAFFLTNGTANTIAWKISLSRSSQDQFIYPRKGSVFSITLQATPPYSLFRKDNFWKLSESEINNIYLQVKNDPNYSNADESTIQQEVNKRVLGKEMANKFKMIEYHKWSFKGTVFTNLIDKLVLATKAEFGYLGYYNKKIGYAPFEKFAVGGSGMYYGNYYYGNEIVALRGYEEGALTPRSKILTSDGDYQTIDNGNLYVKYTMELRYPITTSQSATIYGLAFIEGGNAWSHFKDLNPFNIKRSAGVGIRAFLPMFGMLGIDWGYGFDPQPGETKRHGGEFHFILGQQF